MSAIEDARAALAGMAEKHAEGWCICTSSSLPGEVEAALRALIAEHAFLTEECDWHKAQEAGLRDDIERLTAPPTGDEREALYDGAWRAISGRDEPWGGCVDREKVMRVAEFAAGVRRQGPITDAQVEAAAQAIYGATDVGWRTLAIGWANHYRWQARTALEAAGDAS